MLDMLFFFSSRRRHTSSKRDWSSDVCSSDLVQRGRHTVRGRDLDHSRLLQPAQLQATGVRVERLDGAAKHDVRERLEIELGGERLAQAPHCRLQARALACDE